MALEQVDRWSAVIEQVTRPGDSPVHYILVPFYSFTAQELRQLGSFLAKFTDEGFEPVMRHNQSKKLHIFLAPPDQAAK